jgi:hypothetical protein
MVAAAIRTIFAQPSPAQVREQLGVIAAPCGWAPIWAICAHGFSAPVLPFRVQ